MKEFKCLICGDMNPPNFYVTQKNKCKKCICNEHKDKYKNRKDKTFYIEQQKEWRIKNYLQYQLLQAKHRAKRDKRIFDLTIDIIKQKLKNQNGCCYISKIPIILAPNDQNSLSLDRIDNNKDYTIDNTVIVTKFINNCKNTLNLEEFKKHIKEICKYME